MKENSGMIYDDVAKCVDEVIHYIGKDITFAMTLALGKPVQFINELYRRAKKDPEMKLKIITALSLEIPKAGSELEKRLMQPILDRVFTGVPEFDYMYDFRAGTLPKNVELYEFYSKAGSMLNNPMAQQLHLSSHYTHVVRDAIALGTNVFGELIGYKEIKGKTLYSMACNTDISLEAVRKMKEMRASGRKIAIIGEANKNMPFMYGDAVVEAETYDMILKGPQYDYELFCPPKDSVALTDHMIGINVSPLIKDGGTIQVGIGALGDAIVSGLILRNEHNALYQEILNKAGINKRYKDLISRWGDTGTFKKGLYGSSEMFVDAFMQMYKNKILKRKVFDSIPLMKLINAGKLDPTNIPDDIIDKLLELKAVHKKLKKKDFDFLTEFGILKNGLSYENYWILDGKTRYSADLNDEKNRLEIRKLLGKKLLQGTVILGAFFLGPKAFYHALNNMSDEERQLFAMSSVEKVNQLYGEEELRTLQRKDARFINTGMVASVYGAIASDQLESGQVVSGIGGQYNFVAMGHVLPDSRVIIMIKSTRGSGKSVKSNIVFNYGHCSIPKHMKDIVVTEYGIADIRSKPEKQVIAEMINIADSRFQPQLVEQAKKAGKLPIDYEIPEEYRNNTPQKIRDLLKPYQSQGLFPQFPFGTDLSDIEATLAGALKGLKGIAKGSRLKMTRGMILELFRPIPESAQLYLERMKLLNPSTMNEKFMRKTVVFALRNANLLHPSLQPPLQISNQMRG
ncbi:hypothetical protein Desor_4561 [Desulfosporosinus orientis DSM 765]|uniref:Acetyl-CoA hydrolase/transferase C-terminal domain-containing protein n=1 Tax=Desulfosporosinus orientis (strain ATCC 19365 / DSM 765 / NCIMB 8382 / VKM B-1628 / Singapore I) TaxID=768706 RepID=G7WBZ2_DESOD|nr:acetyl-CoA hydrolase/transferase C-terminal domain-containing protein [Desulfosporosinus orientis]AET69966.1 hypothetical protein Desor_4561 [Desulfosporosinus orientis DSM 765]